MKEPEPMKEVHEWRDKLYEKEKHLSHKEWVERTRQVAQDAIRRYGLTFRHKDKAA